MAKGTDIKKGTIPIKPEPCTPSQSPQEEETAVVTGGKLITEKDSEELRKRRKRLLFVDWPADCIP